MNLLAAYPVFAGAVRPEMGVSGMGEGWLRTDVIEEM